MADFDFIRGTAMLSLNERAHLKARGWTDNELELLSTRGSMALARRAQRDLQSFQEGSPPSTRKTSR